jgi:hypothetical protein
MKYLAADWKNNIDFYYLTDLAGQLNEIMSKTCYMENYKVNTSNADFKI